MPELSAADATAIAQLWTDYGAAFARGDARAIADLYTPDGDMTAVDGTHVTGPDAIADYYRSQQAGGHQGVTLRDVELMAPRAVSSEVGLMNASWMVHGAGPGPFRVRTTFVARRGALGWRFAAVRFAAALAAAQDPAASAERHRAAKRRYIEAFNSRDLSTMDELFAAEYVLHVPGLPDVHGPDGLRRMLEHSLGTWPDARLCADEMLAEGDRLVTRWTLSAAHREESPGMAATHRPFTVSGVIVERFVDGRIAEAWETVDLAGFQRQPGVAPA